MNTFACVVQNVQLPKSNVCPRPIHQTSLLCLYVRIVTLVCKCLHTLLQLVYFLQSKLYHQCRGVVMDNILIIHTRLVWLLHLYNYLHVMYSFHSNICSIEWQKISSSSFFIKIYYGFGLNHTITKLWGYMLYVEGRGTVGRPCQAMTMVHYQIYIIAIYSNIIM